MDNAMFYIVGIVAIIVIALGGYVIWYFFFRNPNAGGGGGGGDCGNGNGDVTTCIPKVATFLSNLPTKAENFVDALNNGLQKFMCSINCTNTINITMFDGNGYHYIFLFKNGESKMLNKTQFKAGDILTFKVCSYLDLCNSEAHPTLVLGLT